MHLRNLIVPFAASTNKTMKSLPIQFKHLNVQREFFNELGKQTRNRRDVIESYTQTTTARDSTQKSSINTADGADCLVLLSSEIFTEKETKNVILAC